MIYPNPCDREKAHNGTLKIELPDVSDVAIYNIETYLVFQKKGVTGRIEWDGKNMDGEKVAPGIYFYIIDIAGSRHQGKIFITK